MTHATPDRRRTSRALLLAALLLTLLLPMSAEGNLGHRLGGDVFKPENTLVCYRKALATLQDRADFHYVELDVQETRDGGIVVFHDTRSIKRLVPRSPDNLAVLRPVLKDRSFASIRIADLTTAQVLQLQLAKGARIPTLEAVLKASVAWTLRKPMLIEVKSIRTDACRRALIELVAPYRARLTVDFLAFPAAYRASFPDPLRWRVALKRHRFKVFTALKPKTAANDLARLDGAVEGGRRFRTVLAETPFQIKTADARTVRFPVALPSLKGSAFAVRVGIEHGYDDTGDRGVRFRLSNGAGEVLLNGFSRARGWQWFEVPVDPAAELTLAVEDRDTRLTGRHPGNGGRVKVNLRYAP